MSVPVFPVSGRVSGGGSRSFVSTNFQYPINPVPSVVGAFCTVTLTLLERALVPGQIDALWLESYAEADFVTAVELFHVIDHGIGRARITVPTAKPSTVKLTLATPEPPELSVALAVRFTELETTLPFAWCSYRHRRRCCASGGGFASVTA